jgi:hypothetical protein
MNRRDKATMHVAVALATATGLAYGYVLYFVESDDPFALVHHPWQPTLRDAHVLAVVLVVFAFGLLWPQHVRPKLRSTSPDRRRTGWALLVLLPVMAVTGYLLQLAGEPSWRTAWAWAHDVSSVLFCVVFVVHLCLRVRAPR